MKLKLACLVFVLLTVAVGQLYTNVDTAPIIVEQLVTGTLTATQIKALNTTSVTLIPAQGAGTAIIIDNGAFEGVYGGTVFSSSSQLLVGYGSLTSLYAIAGNGCAPLILEFTTNEFCSLGPVQQTAGGVASGWINQSIGIWASSAFTLGNGTLLYWIRYHVLNGLQ